MGVNKEERRQTRKRSRCQASHLSGKDSSSCAEPAREEVDGLLLCERHALEAKLEGQIECWGGMLLHIELWAREAGRREREDIVGLLEVQRAEATSARQLARIDLDRLRSTDTPLGTRGTLGSMEEVIRRGPLERVPLKRVPSSSKSRPAARSRASTSST